ncbi:Orf y [Tanacetum coccineum]|uniref:TPA: Orf y n=1 Tax=Tanacetum coccineum TaxID=301880 RepID=A0ABQ5A839_9ASTR
MCRIALLHGYEPIEDIYEDEKDVFCPKKEEIIVTDNSSSSSDDESSDKYVFPHDLWENSPREIIATIANGDTIKINQVCRNISLKLSGYEFNIPTIYQQDSGIDLILGPRAGIYTNWGEKSIDLSRRQYLTNNKFSNLEPATNGISPSWRYGGLQSKKELQFSKSWKTIRKAVHLEAVQQRPETNSHKASTEEDINLLNQFGLPFLKNTIEAKGLSDDKRQSTIRVKFTLDTI